MNISEALLLLWFFCCTFIVVAVALYQRIEKNKKTSEHKKLNLFTLIMINIPAFVFGFFMLVVMIVGVLFYV